MAGKFKRKPVVCGVPLHGLQEGATARNILLNPARTAGENSTPIDADNGWNWKNRLLLPGAVNLSDNKIIYLDGNNTPYVISFTVTTPSTFDVRVVATLVSEFGVFGISVPVHNRVVFDETISLADGSDVSYTSVTSLQSAVEQSPSGADVLLNIGGSFVNTNGGYELKSGCRTLAGIIQANINGTVAGDGTGLSGGLSVYKTVAECSPVYTEEYTDARSTVHWRRSRVTSFVSASVNGDTDNWRGDDGCNITPTPLYDINITGTTTISQVSGAGTTTTSGQADDVVTGNTSDIKTQQVIHRAYFTSDGVVSFVGFCLTHTSENSYSETTSLSNNVYTNTIRQYAVNFNTWEGYSFEDRCNPNAYLAFCSNGQDYTPPTGTISRSDVDITTNTYKVEMCVDGVSQSSEEYKHTVTINRSGADSGFSLSPASGAGDVVYEKSGAGTYESLSPYVPNDALHYTPYVTDVPVPYITDMAGYVSNTTYTEDNWGVITNDSSPILDQGFSYFNLLVTGDRFSQLENVELGLYSNGASAYGSSLNGKKYITYDPYTDTITDSDTPIGYV